MRLSYLTSPNRPPDLSTAAMKALQTPHHQIVNIVGLLKPRASTPSDVTPPDHHCGVSKPRVVSGVRMSKEIVVRCVSRSRYLYFNSSNCSLKSRSSFASSRIGYPYQFQLLLISCSASKACIRVSVASKASYGVQIEQVVSGSNQPTPYLCPTQSYSSRLRSTISFKTIRMNSSCVSMTVIQRNPPTPSVQPTPRPESDRRRPISS